MADNNVINNISVKRTVQDSHHDVYNTNIKPRTINPMKTKSSMASMMLMGKRNVSNGKRPTKRDTKLNSRRKHSSSSVAPLLETISALAAYSDQSGSDLSDCNDNDGDNGNRKHTSRNLRKVSRNPVSSQENGIHDFFGEDDDNDDDDDEYGYNDNHNDHNDEDEEDEEDEYDFSESQPFDSNGHFEPNESLRLDIAKTNSNDSVEKNDLIPSGDVGTNHLLDSCGAGGTADLSSGRHRRANVNQLFGSNFANDLLLFPPVSVAENNWKSSGHDNKPMLIHNSISGGSGRVKSNHHTGSNSNAKCVRFNSDVQITSVSPRMGAKFGGCANNFHSSSDIADSTKVEKAIIAGGNNISIMNDNNDDCQRQSRSNHDLHEYGSMMMNTYDEVASIGASSATGHSPPPQLSVTTSSSLSQPTQLSQSVSFTSSSTQPPIGHHISSNSNTNPDGVGFHEQSVSNAHNSLYNRHRDTATSCDNKRVSIQGRNKNASRKQHQQLLANSGSLSTSSSATSISDSEIAQQQKHLFQSTSQSTHVVQYANIEMIQTVAQIHEPPPQSSLSSLLPKEFVSGNKSNGGLNNHSYYQPPPVSGKKSILKDPLCAKLRSAIKQGQFVLTDTAQLESEIDTLLYGNESNQRFPATSTSSSNSSTVTNTTTIAITNNPHEAIHQSDLEQTSATESLTLGSSVDEAKHTNKLSRNSRPKTANKRNNLMIESGLDLTRFDDRANHQMVSDIIFHNDSKFQGFSSRRKPPTSLLGVTSQCDIAPLPCNSYIQMIEEKYRNKDTSSNHHANILANANCDISSQQQSRISHQSNKGNKSFGGSGKNCSNKNANITTGKHSGKLQESTVDFTKSMMTSGQKKPSATSFQHSKDFDIHSKHTKPMSQQLSLLNNLYHTKGSGIAGGSGVGANMKSSSQIQNTASIVPQAPPFTTSMDQLMSALLQESESPNVDSNCRQPKSLVDPIGSANIKLIKRSNNNTTANTAISATKMSNKVTKNNTNNEKLYSLFADPIKGPCINLLMDELSRSFENKNSLLNTESDTESIGSNRSSLYIARSLAENHIYEEILYECLEQQDSLLPIGIGEHLQPPPPQPTSVDMNGLCTNASIDIHNLHAILPTTINKSA